MRDVHWWSRNIAALALCGAVALIHAGAARATESGFYLGGAVGQSEFKDIGELEDICRDAGIQCNTNENDTAIRLFGGYQFNNYIAIEAGYLDLGTLDAGVSQPISATASFKFSGGSLSLLPQIPLGEVAAIFAIAGVGVGKAELIGRVPSVGIDERDSATVPAVILGFGGAVNLGRRVTLRAAWERYSFDEVFTIAGEDIDAPDIDVISGAVLIRF